jgi:hypothetical protein
MTGALGYEDWSWRVIEITHEAIASIVKNNFKYTTGLQRDHYKKSRAQTYNEIFSERLDFEEWWKIIWENDETILMTIAEHKTKRISKAYPIDYRMGFYIYINEPIKHKLINCFLPIHQPNINK